jgi:hypothetical protein
MGKLIVYVGLLAAACYIGMGEQNRKKFWAKGL